MALIPSDSKIMIDGDGHPLVEVSFAFSEELDDNVKAAFLVGFAALLAENF